MRRTVILSLCVLSLLAVAAAGGCVDSFSAKTKAELQQNATIYRTWAEQAKAGVISPAESAYMLECEARSSENLNAAAQWKPPVWTKAPSTMPTTLPWKPAD